MASAAPKFGNVYVFNVFSQSVDISVNGMAAGAGTIQDWTNGADATNPKFRPNSIAVGRVLNKSDGAGKFFSAGGGINQVVLQSLQGLFMFSVDMSKPMLNQDMLLFINATNWQLVDIFGNQFSSGSVLSESSLAALSSAAAALKS